MIWQKQAEGGASEEEESAAEGLGLRRRHGAALRPLETESSSCA